MRKKVQVSVSKCKSVKESVKQFHGINCPVCWCLRGKGQVKRCVFRFYLKVASEMAGWTDCSRLFQRDGVQEWKALAPVLVLILGTDRQFHCLTSVNGMAVMGQAWSDAKQAAFHRIFLRPRHKKSIDQNLNANKCWYFWCGVRASIRKQGECPIRATFDQISTYFTLVARNAITDTKSVEINT